MRRYGCIPDLVGVARGFKLERSTPTMTASQLPEEADLSAAMPPPMSQYSEGSCVAHGVTAALRYNWINNGQPDLRLSRNQLYYDTRKREGTTASDAGCQIHNAIDVALEIGVCEETLWPYDLTKWQDAPPDSVYADAIRHQGISKMSVGIDPLAVRTALYIGKPVIIGITVFPSFESEFTAATGEVQMPGSAERALSGHCMLVWGRSAAGFLARNWWQEYNADGSILVPWGLNGDCIIPEAYCTPEYAADFWSLLETETTEGTVSS